MSAQGTRRLAWAGGEDTFCLAKIGTLIELEEKLGSSFGEIATRISSGTWRVADVREIIRLGLIGGGMAAPAALAKVVRYVDDVATYPLGPSVLLCWSLIQAIIVPPDEQPPQKKTDAPEHGSFATTGESADTAAISSVADSVSTLARSMN